MYTEVGKFLRHLRIDKGENLKDMANRLGYSSAFLSGIENGHKKIPNDFFDKMVSIYSLNDDQCISLSEAISTTTKRVEIDLNELEHDQQSVAILFARKVNSMDENLLEKIKNLINSED